MIHDYDCSAIYHIIKIKNGSAEKLSAFFLPMFVPLNERSLKYQLLLPLSLSLSSLTRAGFSHKLQNSHTITSLVELIKFSSSSFFFFFFLPSSVPHISSSFFYDEVHCSTYHTIARPGYSFEVVMSSSS